MKKVLGALLSIALFVGLLSPSAFAAHPSPNILPNKLYGVNDTVDSPLTTEYNYAFKGNIVDDDDSTYDLYRSHRIYIDLNSTFDVRTIKYNSQESGEMSFYDVEGNKIGNTYNFDAHDTSYKSVNYPQVRYVSFYSSAVYSNEIFVSAISSSVPAAPTGLTATSGDKQAVLNWTPSSDSDVSGYKIYKDGNYLATVTSPLTTYTATGLTNGTTYAFQVTAINASGNESPKSNAVQVTPQPSSAALDVVIDKDKIKVGEQFTSDILLKNVSNIYAEDFKINYDSTLLNYVGFEEVPGYKIYNQPTDENGTLRFIVASQGEQYGINGEQVFLKLKFSGKAKGTAKVDALECRIADTEDEYDLEGSSCLEDTIVIEGNKDVNRTGEYTLVDLAIDGFYYGKLAADTDHSKHDADQAGDEHINDDDLLFIVNEMLNNTNYPLNA
ncbi:cohesin domain-containing protein [Cohnella cholangitidis]|uniref:Fibronectin type-III domain-containing protein n=1 Tax=Cohnella cholangitidis TaxID=2598458 RepID=A0A7G5BTF7_9BACL|nr:cohesin domain-containing protein [Cohnella cholangitidis]QMV40241.1 hypothetical protein FPL14_02770 [Cohnella cholangitidis]